MSESSLDNELARAAGNEDAPAVAAQPVAATAPRSNLRLLVVLLMLGAGLTALVLTSFSGAAVYAKSVDQVVAAKAELAGRRLRVDGLLVHGTLERRDQPCEYRFRMEKAGAVLAVRYAQCVVPDTFRDVPGMDVGVTVEGKLDDKGDFEANQVLAKCPSKYEMKDRQTKGDVVPHSDIPTTTTP